MWLPFLPRPEGGVCVLPEHHFLVLGADPILCSLNKYIPGTEMEHENEMLWANADSDALDSCTCLADVL